MSSGRSEETNASPAQVLEMGSDEFDEWLANSPPLHFFPLDSHDGRLGFLRELYNRGYPALFEGVAHVWKLLEEPKGRRCFGIGLAAGTGGKGKAALLKFLSAMIEEGLATISPVPAPDGFASVDEWHEHVAASWQTDEAELCQVLEKYAHLLVGHPFGPKPSVQKGKIIIGPWQPAPTVAQCHPILQPDISQHADDGASSQAIEKGTIDPCST